MTILPASAPPAPASPPPRAGDDAAPPEGGEGFEAAYAEEAEAEASDGQRAEAAPEAVSGETETNLPAAAPPPVDAKAPVPVGTAPGSEAAPAEGGEAPEPVQSGPDSAGIETKAMARTPEKAEVSPPVADGASDLAPARAGPDGAERLMTAPAPAPPPQVAEPLRPPTPPPPAAPAQIAQALQDAPDGRVSLVLNPEELGRLRLSMVPTETGLNVTILAERDDTAALLRRHADELMQEFRALGYDEIAFDFAGRNSAPPDSPPERLEAEDMPLPAPPRPGAAPPATGLDIRL